MSGKKIVFSGIQPTGELHLGNYFGAVSNWVKLQDEHQCVYCVVDLHAMTMPYAPAELRRTSEQMFIDLMAAGLDPHKCTLFVQSMVPEHTELAWVFGCVASYGDLTRQTQFKDKSEQALAKVDEDPTKGSFISAGLFTYPVLQAADILLYRAGYVPVGKDQEQHLELSRAIARRFNFTFGEYFPEPQVLSTDTPKVLSLADPTRKMSKSLGDKHVVSLFADEKTVRSKVRSAVTDSGATAEGELSPGVENLLGLLRACGRNEIAAGFVAEYAAGNRKYAPLKDAVGDALVELTGGMRARREALSADRDHVRKLMHDAAAQAREVAVATMKDVRRMVGLPKH